MNNLLSRRAPSAESLTSSRLVGLSALASALVLMAPAVNATGDQCTPFEKQVSVDGGLTWFDADSPATAPTLPVGGDSQYRFILTNCTSDKICIDTRVRDEILGIIDPNNTAGVLVGDGVIDPQDQVIVTKDTPGFENLDKPGQCIPMNQATETTKIPTGPNSAITEVFSDPAYVICPPPGSIDLEKATNGVDADDPNAGDAPQIAAGDPVTWSYEVTNTGTVGLSNIMLTDTRIGPVNCPMNTLAVGESMLCTAMGIAEDLTLPGAETVPGVCGTEPRQPLYENMGIVSATTERGATVGARDPSHYCNAPKVPAIDLEKLTNGVDADDPNAGDAPQIAPGDSVTWDYLVTNIGGIDLNNVSVTDDRIGAIACPMNTLAVGESMLCSAMGIAEDLNAPGAVVVPGTCGSVPVRPLYENMGNVTAISTTGEFVEDNDPSHYCNAEDPAIDIEKATNGIDADDPTAGDAPQIPAGNPVTWSYVVTNTGAIPLVNIVAMDETLGVTLTCPSDSLGVGESMVCDPITGTAQMLSPMGQNVVLGTCGVTPGSPLYENISRVSGQSLSGALVEDADPSHYCNTPPPLFCGLTVQKGCEILPPPPPPVGKCDGKLQQFTMIWDGGDGAQLSGPQNDAPNGTVNNGDEVTFFGPFSDNDVLVDVAGIGTSTFHVSCSDDDMDGDTESNEDQQQVSIAGRDCGKLQGNGKGGSGANLWLLEGFVDDAGDALDCSVLEGNPGPSDGPLVSSCEFVAQPVSCETAGKPSVITMRYVGGSCPGNNSQDSKSNCSGSIDGSLPATVTLEGGSIGPINPGDTFDVPTTGSNTTIILSNAGGSQTNDVHTSCSAPVIGGETFGNLELIGINGQTGGADVIYSYLISNTGSQTITGITALDDQLGAVPGSPIASLAPGESTTLTAMTLVSETVTNTVTVNGSVPFGAECVATASATVTALAPPPCEVAIKLDKIDDKKIKFKLYNNSAFNAATIESLSISWPGDEKLKKIKLGKDEIFEKDERNAPSTTILESDWTEEAKKRTVKAGDDEKLEIEFKDDFPMEKDQPLSDFTLTITFSQGCSVSIGGIGGN